MRTEDITAQLSDWKNGHPPPEVLVESVYPHLRRIASRRLSPRARMMCFQTTELVHEAFLKLIEQHGVDWRNRTHFFSVAARIVRRIVVDHVRQLRAQKRWGAVARVPLDDLQVAAPGVHPDLLALDQAIESLTVADPDAARVVELRYFGGLSIEETAEVLGVGRSTVVRHWRFARAWLREFLEGAGGGES